MATDVVGETTRESIWKRVQGTNGRRDSGTEIERERVKRYQNVEENRNQS